MVLHSVSLKAAKMALSLVENWDAMKADRLVSLTADCWDAHLVRQMAVRTVLMKVVRSVGN